MLDRLAAWWLRRQQPEQRTFVYCPGCGLELCNTDSFQSDTDLVRYRCIQCGTGSEWMFDAPAPLLIRHARPLTGGNE